MNIGEASRVTGVSSKMIRYYEQIGLIRASRRDGSAYRVFDARALDELGFIRRGRNLGFSVSDIGRLLALWRDPGRSSREVKALAERQIAELEAWAIDLQSMADTLRRSASACGGDDRPDCPILDELRRGGATVGAFENDSAPIRQGGGGR